jgi:hydrogenase expression/formation protein HypC
MCLAIPGMVLEIEDAEPPFNAALVEFAGVRRRVSLACVPKAGVGDYVLVHAGVAISRINADEAAKVLQDLAQLDLAEEFAEPADETSNSKRR